MKDITVTAPDGKQSHLENVYIRGNMIRFVIVPDMLQQAPMFKRIGPNAMKGRGIGSARGRATILRGMCPSLAPFAGASLSLQAPLTDSELSSSLLLLSLSPPIQQLKRGEDEAVHLGLRAQVARVRLFGGDPTNPSRSVPSASPCLGSFTQALYF